MQKTYYKHFKATFVRINLNIYGKILRFVY